MSHPIPTEIQEYIDDILDLMEDGIFVSDRNGITLRVNKAYEHLIGLRADQIEGKTVHELQQGGIFNRILNPRIVKSKKPASVVQELGKDKKTVHLRGFPVLDAHGEVCLVVTFARDVTAITQLREQIADQRRIIEQYHGRIAHILGSQHTAEGIFVSPAMQKLLHMLTRIAETDATVLLLGETGVGKDVLARMVHARSPRKENIFLKVDCGSIAENLIESELFGYVRGAFSGANAQGKAGYFEMADGGTVFLDEIGELPLGMQSKLLRILQDHEFMRVGSSRAQRVDVRIIAATNRDLTADIKEGKFRQDLYYRLNVATLAVPPLRERREDIPLLAQRFLDLYNSKYKKHAHLSAKTLHLLGSHSWPGNVRELENMILRLVITTEHELLDVEDLPERVRDLSTSLAHVPAKPFFCLPTPETPKSLKAMMAEIERNLLAEALQKYGAVGTVAEMFQINRSTLFRKLQRFDDGDVSCQDDR